MERDISNTLSSNTEEEIREHEGKFRCKENQGILNLAVLWSFG